MTEHRRFCVKGHDAHIEGRSASYQCLACKREAGKVARDRRKAEEEEAERARRAKLQEQANRDYKAWRRRVERFQKREMERAAQRRKNPP